MTTSQHVTAPQDLAGRVALVTGATSGIGRAVAVALAARGAHVVVHGRDADRADAVVADIRSDSGRADVVLGDLRHPAETHAVAERATAAGGGRVDILVNNASLFPIGGLTPATSVEDIDAAFAVNVRAPFLLTAGLAPAMAARGDGAIVNVLSTAAHLGVAGLGLYGATKAALGLLTRSWAAEFGPQGVRVNAVSPGPTDTPGTVPLAGVIDHIAAQAPAGRLAGPDEIASAITYLVGQSASFIQGAVLTVDGGRCAV